MKLTVDVQAITRAQGGDISAISEIYSDTYNTLYFLALSLLKNHDDACDAVQDCFTDIIKNFSIKDAEKFSSWICTIVSFKCRNILRKKKNIDLDEEAYEYTLGNMTEESEDFIPESALENKEFLESIRGAISELPLSQRNMVLLHYFSGMSTEEIGELENIPSGTVKSRLWHAREKIRQHLKKGGLIALLLLSSSMLCKALELIAGENQLDPQKAASIFSKAMESAGIPVAPAKAPTTPTTTNTGGKTMKAIITKIIISIIAVVTIAGGAVTIITINKNTDDTTLPAVSDSEYTGRTTASTSSTTAASRTTTASSSTTANGRPGATGAATTTSAGSRTTTTTTKATTAMTTATTTASAKSTTYNLVEGYTRAVYDDKVYCVKEWSYDAFPPDYRTINYFDGVLTYLGYEYTTNCPYTYSDDSGIMGELFYSPGSNLDLDVQINGSTIIIKYVNGNGDYFPNPDKYPEMYNYKGKDCYNWDEYVKSSTYGKYDLYSDVDDSAPDRLWMLYRDVNVYKKA